MNLQSFVSWCAPGGVHQDDQSKMCETFEDVCSISAKCFGEDQQIGWALLHEMCCHERIGLAK